MSNHSLKQIIQRATIFLATLPMTLSADNSSDNEAFLKRRIIEFAKDQDYKTVVKQIKSFMQDYPDSDCIDDLLALLAEVYLMDRNYTQAELVYESIERTGVKDKIIVNLMQCYYEKKAFDKILACAEPYINSDNAYIQKKIDVFNFLLAESYFYFAKNEGKDELIDKAKPLYEGLISSAYSINCKFSLAQIYKKQGAFEQASEYFLELSKNQDELSEDLLFHAALCQSEFAKDRAIASFNQIIAMNGDKLDDARLNRFILLFQNEEYQSIVDELDTAKSLASLANNEQVYYLIGHSFFKLKEYQQAHENLKQYANLCDNKSDTYRNALLMQLNAVKHLDSQEEYSAIVEDLKTNFADDSELPKALFIQAMMLKDQGHTAEAESLCRSLLKDYPDFSDAQALLLQTALLSHANQNFESSYHTLKDYISQHPNSEQINLSYKYLLSCSIERLKNSEENDLNNYSKQEFLDDLTLVLKQDNILTINEEKEALFLQAKACYELESYDEALSYFHKYIEKYNNDPSTTQANLLIALSHHKLGSPAEKFCIFAERALAQDSVIKTKSAIHLELYNVYLSMLEKESGSNLEITLDDGKVCQVVDLAAEHLYKATILQDLPLQLENRLWLVNYYYKKISSPSFIYEQTFVTRNNENNNYYQRSLDIYTNIFKPEGQDGIKQIAKEELFLESEALKYCSLLGTDQLNKKIQILENLVEQQSRNEKWNWKLKNEVMIELAKSYELSGETTQAFETYEFIAKKDSSESNFTTQFAFIHSSRLKYKLMENNQKTSDNPQILALLEKLKEMQIKKSALSEPVHIDAAIEYAKLRQNLAVDGQKGARYLFFLERIKDDYESQNDPIALRYHEEMKDKSDKKFMYQTYMTYIDAEILRTKAFIEGSDNKALEIEYSRKSGELLKSLQPCTKTHYLELQVQESLALLKGKTLS
jgi:tetratricopeptide (TPR) repeat protein